MEPINCFNDNENGNHKRYSEEQSGTFSLKISSKDNKQETKEQFTLVSLRET
jgi:hypothetical protein